MRVDELTALVIGVPVGLGILHMFWVGRSRARDERKYGAGLAGLTDEQLKQLINEKEAEARMKREQAKYRATLVTKARIAQAALDGACANCGHHWCSCSYGGY